MRGGAHVYVHAHTFSHVNMHMHVNTYVCEYVYIHEYSYVYECVVHVPAWFYVYIIDHLSEQTTHYYPNTFTT